MLQHFHQEYDVYQSFMHKLSIEAFFIINLAEFVI